MSRPLTYWVVISEDNQLYKMWHLLEIVACLLSSYYYAALASFHDSEGNPKLVATTLVFELFFLISIVLKFFLEYKVDDSPLPVRDLGMIAKRYIRNEFLFDLIPLIPAP